MYRGKDGFYSTHVTDISERDKYLAFEILSLIPYGFHTHWIYDNIFGGIRGIPWKGPNWGLVWFKKKLYVILFC